MLACKSFCIAGLIANQRNGCCLENTKHIFVIFRQLLPYAEPALLFRRSADFDGRYVQIKIDDKIVLMQKEDCLLNATQILTGNLQDVTVAGLSQGCGYRAQNCGVE